MQFLKNSSDSGITIDIERVLSTMDIDDGIKITYFDTRKKILINRTYLNQFVIKIYHLKNQYIKYFNSVCDTSKFLDNEENIKKISHY